MGDACRWNSLCGVATPSFKAGLIETDCAALKIVRRLVCARARSANRAGCMTFAVASSRSCCPVWSSRECWRCFSAVACLLVLAEGFSPAAAAAEPGVSTEWREIAAAFATPPAEFRLIQYGTHDGAALPMARMAEAGIGGVMLFMQSNGYLRSDDAWRNLEANIHAARVAGVKVWMADDNGYPSGMAGGLVVEVDPAFESRGLVAVTQDGAGPGPARLELPGWAEAFAHARLYPMVDGRPALDQGQPAAVHPDRVCLLYTSPSPRDRG